MVVDLQKASFWKRVAAWLFDGILLCVLAVGCGTLLAEVLHYDTHEENLPYAVCNNDFAAKIKKAVMGGERFSEVLGVIPR